MGQGGDGASSAAFHTQLHHYCDHASAREIRMYTSYADANGVRLRVQSASEPGWRHVSTLYEIANGWAWTVCNECPADAGRARPSRRAVGE
jgi:hypothetical protein